MKTQVMIDFESFRILDVAQGRGPVSDLMLFKKSDVHLMPEVWCLADGGYLGLQALHPQTTLPVKKPRHRDLNAGEKHDNGRLAKLRIHVEHVIRWLKVFRILSERYRNRRKRLGLRFNLIAGLHNFELVWA
jgi:hypothetical protein